MKNLREVNDDILKDWFIYRDEDISALKSDEDKQLDLLYDDFMRYLTYITEKYYRNGFCDGVQLIGRCFEK